MTAARLTGATDGGPLAEPACARTDGSWCQRAYDLTGADWLARSAGTIADTTLSVLTIVVVAFALRWIAHRTINKLAQGAALGRTHELLTRRGRKQATAHDLATPNFSERRRQRARTVGSVLRSCASFLIYGVAFVMVLGEFGINLAPIIASAGVLGLAIGFGAQNLVRDFLSGIFMMLEDQYGVGDSVDLGAAVGEVESVGLRTTKLRDIAGTVWYVRNGEILRVGNSSQGFAVAVVDIPVGHGANLSRAADVASEAAQVVASDGHVDDVIEAPTMLGVQEITPYAVVLRVTAKTRPGRQWAVQRTLRAKLVAALDEEGVPTPSATVAPLSAAG
ncbi:MAG: mechanosensitive ion channel family protein [Sciscionella sp.]